MEAVKRSMKTGILKRVEDESPGSNLISGRVSSPYYITDDRSIGEIAEILTDDSSIQAVGVTDLNGKAAGVVVRSELFALIGQKFGRELYLNRSIKEVMRPAEFIYYRRNTFSVIDELNTGLRSEFNRYYILVDSGNSFRGIISTFDLVLFLSEMMTRELKSARRIHSAIVKDRVNISGRSFEVSGSIQMAGETGGDFHYIRRIDEERWFITLCDVSGKGLNAGLISVAVSSMCAVYDFSRGIDSLITGINSYIHGLFGGEIFLTGVFLEFNESSNELAVYDLGHSMIYVIREGKAGSPSRHRDNIPLGVLDEITPVKALIRLEEGDVVVAYTDGLPEQGNISGEEFGEQRILSLVQKYRKSPPARIHDIMYEEIRTWRIGNAQGDDMSILLLRVK